MRMLSHQESRRLQDIERRLEREDPAFARRMRRRVDDRSRYARAVVCAYLLAWIPLPVLANLLGQREAAVYAGVLGAVFLLSYFVLLLRRFHQYAV